MPGFTPIDRRTVLRGAGGAALALPLLEAMAAPREEVASPKRMVATGIFFGLMPDLFHPQDAGRDYTTPKLLKPLEQLRDDFTVFSGLDHNIGGGHAATKYFLTGIPIEHARGYAEGNISVDQKAAHFVGGQTRYPSLSLGCNTGSDHHISWTQNSQAIRPVDRPSQLFNMLFRNDSKEQRGRQKAAMADQRSILDLVRGRADAFTHRLSKADTEKLDQYFTSVRDLERRVERSAQWLNEPKPSTDYEVVRGADSLTLKDKTPIFYDLMVLALQMISQLVLTKSNLKLKQLHLITIKKNFKKDLLN